VQLFLHRKLVVLEKFGFWGPCPLDVDVVVTFGNVCNGPVQSPYIIGLQ